MIFLTIIEYCGIVELLCQNLCSSFLNDALNLCLLYVEEFKHVTVYLTFNLTRLQNNTCICFCILNRGLFCFSKL